MNTELYYNSSDTICAISTPPGAGGVAVARVSGEKAFDIVGKIWRGKDIDSFRSHTAHLGEIINPADDTVLDQAVLTVFRSPRSFTGDDVAEISVHGSKWIQRQLLNALISSGARLALPGEFTRRAFASGKMDLAEAEAVADLIASSSAAAHRQAMTQMRGAFSKHIEETRAKLVELASLLELELDFSEEDVEFASRRKLHDLAAETARTLLRLSDSFATGCAVKDGIPVAIIGKTNVGKSSLLNTLLGDDRAIVSEIHGTTRDIVEDTAEIGQYLVRFKDTAGIRQSDDPVENIGIERSRKAADEAMLVLLLIDSAEPDVDGLGIERLDPERTIVVYNKTDLCEIPRQFRDKIDSMLPGVRSVAISALNENGIEELKVLMTDVLNKKLKNSSESDILVTNARHAQAFAAAATLLTAVADGIDNMVPVDLIAQDLREAIQNLASVTGEITTPEILQNIFQSFCIGK